MTFPANFGSNINQDGMQQVTRLTGADPSKPVTATDLGGGKVGIDVNAILSGGGSLTIVGPNQPSTPATTTSVIGGHTGLDVVVIGGVVSGNFTPQGLTTAGLVTVLNIDDTQWYEAPPTALANRNNISIQNQSTNGGTMIWNYSASAPSTAGFQVGPGSSRSLSITGSIPVYIRMLSGTGIACVEELS